MPYDITEGDFNVPAPKERFDISESDFGPPPTKPYGRIRSFSSLPPAPTKLQPGEFAMLPVEEQRRMVEQQLDADAEQARAEELHPGMLATIAREAGAGVIPALAAGAGYALGAPLGAGAGPVGSIATGLGGSVLAGSAASDVQDAAAQAIAPEAYGRFKEQLEAGRQEYPIAAAAGRLIAALPTFSVSAPTTGLELAKRFGIGAGITAIPAVARGELPSAQEVIEGGVGGVFLGEPRARILRAPILTRGGESSAIYGSTKKAIRNLRQEPIEGVQQVPAEGRVGEATARSIEQASEAPQVQPQASEVLLSQSAINEPSATPEMIGDLALSPSSIKQLDTSLSGKLLGGSLKSSQVKSSVISLLHNPEIRDAIVPLLPVDVVDNFIGSKGASKMVLQDPSVLLELLSKDLSGPVPLRFLESVRSTAAGIRTMLAERGMGGPNIEGTSADITSHGAEVNTPQATTERPNEKAQGKEEALRETVAPEAGAVQEAAPALQIPEGAKPEAIALAQEYNGRLPELEQIAADNKTASGSALESARKRAKATGNPDLLNTPKIQELSQKHQASEEAVKILKGQPTPAAKASPEQLSPALAEGEPSASVQQSPGAMAVGIAPPGTGIAEKIIDWARTLPAKLSGKAAPLTSRAAEESGNALVRFASSKAAAPQVAKARATEVLGEHYNDPEFSKKLGAVLVEDRLRSIKRSMAERGDAEGADNVTSIIGAEDSPFRTEEDFLGAMNDPEIRAAIERHKQIIQPEAEAAHEATGGELSGPGENTGAFVNLKAILPETEEFLGATSKGNLENPLKRFTKFGKEAKGTAEKYELDYRTLGERMIRGNYEELSKRQLYDQLIRDGLAKEQEPGLPAPKIGGRDTKRFTIERSGGRTRYLWVRKDLAGEFRRAEDVEGPIESAAAITAAQVLNRIQLAGPTDAVWHVANMVGSIAGSQGGRNVLEELVRKLPGVNVADALSRITASAIKVMRDTPEIQQQIADITKIGAGRETHGGGMLSRLIGLVDKAGRLVRDDMYQNLVDRGLVTDSEATRREWINQLGQYNPRLMGQFQRFFKEAGFSPFIVAGRNFNRMAARRITLDPGIKAANPAAYWEMKGIEAFGIMATLVAVPSLINLATVGKPSGRPGVKFGQIDTGKNDASGKPIVIDPAQWTGLRRGLRISGAQAVIEGLKEGAPREKITQIAITDVLGGVIHPWAGPAVSVPYIAVTGKSPTQYKESDNPNDYGANTKAALKQLNPVAEAILSGHEKDKGSVTAPLTEVGKSLGGAIGIKSVTPFTAQQSIYNAAHNWMKQSGDPKLVKKFEDSLKESEPSDYKPLRDALKANDQAKAKEEIAKLLQTKSRKDLGTAMLKHRDYPFSGAKATEGKFIRSLTPKQRIMLDKAKEERRAEYRRFREVFSK